jgi:hypothetical protein
MPTDSLLHISGDYRLIGQILLEFHSNRIEKQFPHIGTNDIGYLPIPHKLSQNMTKLAVILKEIAIFSD